MHIFWHLRDVDEHGALAEYWPCSHTSHGMFIFGSASLFAGIFGFGMASCRGASVHGAGGAMIVLPHWHHSLSSSEVARQSPSVLGENGDGLGYPWPLLGGWLLNNTVGGNILINIPVVIRRNRGLICFQMQLDGNAH
jgi:hypothetical protein